MFLQQKLKKFKLFNLRLSLYLIAFY